MSRVMYPELKKQLMHRNKTSMIPFFLVQKHHLVEGAIQFAGAGVFFG